MWLFDWLKWGTSRTPKASMPGEPSQLDQAVSRALRDSLVRVQRTTEELSAAIADLVNACGSNRPGNTLPPMVRAQASAASLAASLEVLAKFVTRALQAPPQAEEAKPVVRAVATEAPAAPAAPPVAPPERIPTPMAATPAPAAQPEPPAFPIARADAPASFLEPPAAEVPPPSPDSAPEVHVELREDEIAIEADEETLTESPELAAAEVAEQAAAVEFDINALPADEQEMHRRANRVAKVSMQDIKLLRPDQVRLGREHKDLCTRLRDDIEKARKEYDRRFQPILNHPVDYFYHWMVEVLGEGDPQSLGEYPYSSPVLRR
jgi:hypothetical protein